MLTKQDLSNERWKRHPIYSAYAVSNMGRVKRLDAGPGAVVGRILKQRQAVGKAYMVVGIMHDGKRSTKCVHVLVLETYRGLKPTERHMTRHLDGDGANNKLANLVWGTHEENMRDRDKHGTTIRGTRVVQHKLTEEQVVEIYKKTRGDSTVAKARELAEEYGVNEATVRYIRDRKTWRHVNV